MREKEQGERVKGREKEQVKRVEVREKEEGERALIREVEGSRGVHERRPPPPFPLQKSCGILAVHDVGGGQIRVSRVLMPY